MGLASLKSESRATPIQKTLIEDARALERRKGRMAAWVVLCVGWDGGEGGGNRREGSREERHMGKNESHVRCTSSTHKYMRSSCEQKYIKILCKKIENDCKKK